MKFLNLQLALFPNGIITKPIDEVSVELKKQIPSLVDPVFIPLPVEMPPEIPMLKLTSLDKIFECSVARSRVDFFYRTKDSDREKDFIQHKKDFSAYLTNFFTYFSSLIPIKRIGYITNYFEESKNSAEYIQNILIKKNLGKLSEMNIRYSEIIDVSEKFALNSITKIDSAKLLTEPPVLGIAIQRDINTIAEKDYAFDQELYDAFIEYAEKNFIFKEVEKILN